MRRLFWISLGASAGILIARQIRRTAADLAPANLVTRAAATARAFWDDAREFAAEREVELRESFGLDRSDDGAA